MSGSLPTTPKFRAISPRSERTVVMSTSLSMRTQARNLGGQRWAFTIQYPPLTRADFAPIDAFIESQAGQTDTFTITPTLVGGQVGTATGSIVTSGSASLGAKSIGISGITGTLKAGTFFKFSTHAKVYKVTADRAGAGTLTFEPGLRLGVAGGVAITYNNVPFTVRMSSPVYEYSIATDAFITFEFDVIEAT